MKINQESINKQERGEIQKKFGKRVAELRNKKNITQEKFSFEIGVDRTYVSYIERGKRNPSLYMLYKFAKALNVKLSDLFSF